MQPSISAPSAERSVIDHAANEPESPKADGPETNYDRELERTTRARTYFEDHDPINAAIPLAPCWSRAQSVSSSRSWCDRASLLATVSG
jgi:hypothetical protein